MHTNNLRPFPAVAFTTEIVSLLSLRLIFNHFPLPY
jgi:hypothetical protein